MKSCLTLHSFLVKNANIELLEEKGVLVHFYRFEVQVVRNWPSRLGKNPIKHLKFSYGRCFKHF